MSNEKKSNGGVHAALSRARAAMRRQPLCPTGKNSFLKFNYFELGDFLPQALDALDAEGLTPLFSFTADVATLNITDGKESLLFACPVAAAKLSGKDPSPIQELGAQQTYLRRYLYMAALEITEHDALDGSLGDPEQEKKASAGKPAKTQPTPATASSKGNGKGNGNGGAAKKPDKELIDKIFSAFEAEFAQVAMTDLEHLASEDADFPIPAENWGEKELGRLREGLRRIKGGESAAEVLGLAPGWEG